MILICLDDNGCHSLCVRLFDDFVMCCGVVLLLCVLLVSVLSRWLIFDCWV